MSPLILITACIGFSFFQILQFHCTVNKLPLTKSSYSKKDKLYKNEPAHEILVLIAYAQMSLINAHTDVSGEARGQKFGLSLQLPPCFVYAISEDSRESAHMRRLAIVFATRRCDKDRNLVLWPIFLCSTSLVTCI